MIYNYMLNTGTSTITGSVSTDVDNNQQASFILDSFYIPILNRTGTNNLIVSLNSQTLIERDPTSQDSQFGKIYSTSGDFYFITGESISKMFFENFDAVPLLQRNLLFDLRPFNKIALGTGVNNTQISNSLVSDIRLNLTGYSGNLNQLDYFLNGQKLYSGSGSYGIVNNTGFLYSGVATGKVFAIPQKQNTLNFTGLKQDVYGQDFIENEVNLYINGMEQNKNSWIEMTTGVTLIRTGVVCQIFEEVNSTQVINL